MTFNEEKGNLFEDVKDDTVYAHCIAQDDNYGAGIAPIFVKFFKIKSQLSKELSASVEAQEFGNEGFCILIGNTANLVTKNHTSAKPTYKSITNSLCDLKRLMILNGYKKLCIPKIGCGLDRLSWPLVREIINDVFKDTDINIKVKIK